jgi:23S rRNA (uridine2552-2'-O)-methyltransferase
MARRHRAKKSWLEAHRSDHYVQQARAAGYRSRAVYKLMEIDDRDRLFRPGMCVVDLGAAPGGWSQVVAQRLGGRGRVIALDVLPCDPLPGVEFLQGDFMDDEVFEKIVEMVGEGGVDVVISDMAPNISGRGAVDQPRSMYLAELAAGFAGKALRKGGDMLVKVFQGEGFEAYVKRLRAVFAKVAIRKPRASRSQSREVYVLARQFRGTPV